MSTQPLLPILPQLDWVPTGAYGSRGGAEVVRVVVHRWGVNFTTLVEEAKSYLGVERWFENVANQVSAHVVFPGSAVPNRAAQMVAWDEKAWAEADYNASSDEIECADAIWLGDDEKGMRQLARIVAFRLHVRGLPAVYSAERGFCRHADLGEAGGGHLECPTTDMTLWHAFVGLVQAEARRGGFRKTWGR